MSSSLHTLGVAPNLQLLKPLLAMASWTLIAEVWMYAGRIPAIIKYNVSSDPNKVAHEMATKIPPRIRWKADNYNHLHEQPQVFYAVVAALAIAGDRDVNTLRAAWAYVGVRVVHSLWQSLLNVVPVRFLLFGSSGVVLAGLTGRAAWLLF